jgi:hypothetical protein
VWYNRGTWRGATHEEKIMPLYINPEGVIKQITFDKPVQIAEHEIESPWWQKTIAVLWRMVMGYK